MRLGSGVKGYPTTSTCFATGGINCFDDMDSSAANYAARAVDGSVEGLEPELRASIGFVWLGNNYPISCINVEKDAIDAVRIIWRGLQLRGVC